MFNRYIEDSVVSATGEDIDGKGGSKITQSTQDNTKIVDSFYNMNIFVKGSKERIKFQQEFRQKKMKIKKGNREKIQELDDTGSIIKKFETMMSRLKQRNFFV